MQRVGVKHPNPLCFNLRIRRGEKIEKFQVKSDVDFYISACTEFIDDWLFEQSS